MHCKFLSAKYNFVFLETTGMTEVSKQSKTVKLIEKPSFIQEDDTASPEYSSEEIEIVPSPVSSKKEASTLSGKTLQY